MTIFLKKAALALPLALAILAILAALYSLNARAQVYSTFPDEPFNGMQIQYKVSGVSVGSPKDTPGNYTREYRGSATGNNVHVTCGFYFTGHASRGGTTWGGSIRLYNVPWPYDENLLAEPAGRKALR